MMSLVSALVLTLSGRSGMLLYVQLIFGSGCPTYGMVYVLDLPACSTTVSAQLSSNFSRGATTNVKHVG